MPKRRAVLLKIPMASDDVRSRLCDQEIFVFAPNVYAKFLSLRAQPVYGIKNGHDFKAYSVDALLQYVMVNLSKFFSGTLWTARTCWPTGCQRTNGKELHYSNFVLSISAFGIFVQFKFSHSVFYSRVRPDHPGPKVPQAPKVLR